MSLRAIPPDVDTMFYLTIPMLIDFKVISNPFALANCDALDILHGSSGHMWKCWSREAITIGIAR